jgi:RHS repeat-associated protein
MTITHAYDQDGRLKTYTDADGNQSTYTYDVMGRPTTVNDGKGTQTLSYDQGSEQRGLLTGIADSQAGSFSLVYNADGAEVAQTYPNGMTATTTVDASGQAIGLAYVKTSNCSSACTWLSDQVVPTIHDQWSSQSSSLSGQSYTYDAIGRLTWVYDTIGGQCTTRQYGLDADSNRTSLTTRAPNSDGSCNTTSGGTTNAWTYDAADRVTNAGYSLDSMGRITTVPASDANGTALTATYYASGKVSGLTQGTSSETTALDPTGRIRQWTKGAVTQTYHFVGDTDSPSWTTENTTGSAWTRNVSAGATLAAIADQNGTAALQLSDLHGDIIATASSNTAATALTATFEQTEFGVTRSGVTDQRYEWLGDFGRRTSSEAGAISMGARVYLPTVGRFLQPDPLPGESANSYDYAAQDPVNDSDLSGACPSGSVGHHLDFQSTLRTGLITHNLKFYYGAITNWCWRNVSGAAAITSFQSTHQHKLGGNLVIHWSWDEDYFIVHKVSSTETDVSGKAYFHKCEDFIVGCAPIENDTLTFHLEFYGHGGCRFSTHLSSFSTIGGDCRGYTNLEPTWYG